MNGSLPLNSCFFSRLSRIVGFDFSFWLLTTLIFSLYFQGNSCPKPKDYLQDNKKFHPTSCLDYLLKDASACGMNRLYDTSGNSFPAYCDFKSEPGFAWTLVMSWANKYRALSTFQSNTFKKNTPVNVNSLIWNMYRLSLTRMRSLQAHSTHWRATCSYPTHGVDFTDYVRGNFKDLNIVEYLNDGKPCKKVELLNIRGHMGIYLTAPFWQSTSYPFTHRQQPDRLQFQPEVRLSVKWR